MFRVIATGEVLYEHEVEDQYEELLNDSFGLVEVCGHSYEAGRLLREVDPIAFREALLSYTDSMIQGGEWEEV